MDGAKKLLMAKPLNSGNFKILGDPIGEKSLMGNKMVGSECKEVLIPMELKV